MSMRSRFALAGITLLVGGLTAGMCHLFSSDSPRDVAHLAQYAPLSAPVHLLLFAGGMLVLLGWFGHYALQYSSSGTVGFTAFVGLFLGIMCGDLLHCILEFSVFPVLNSEAPYALPGLADRTYQATPIAVLVLLGRFSLCAGAAAAAISLYRRRRLGAAFPFAVTALLQAATVFPRLAEPFSTASIVALYFSMAALGIAVLHSVRLRHAPAARVATYPEPPQPLER